MKLAGKIISAFAVTAVLPVALMSILLYLFLSSSTDSEYNRRAEMVALMFRQHYNSELARLERSALELSSDSDFLVQVLDLPDKEEELTEELESRVAKGEFQLAVVRIGQPSSVFKAFQDGLEPFLEDYHPAGIVARESERGIKRLSAKHPSSLAIVSTVPIVFRDQLIGDLMVGSMITTSIERFPLAVGGLSALMVSADNQPLFALSSDSLLKANLSQIASVRIAESTWQASLLDHEYFVYKTVIVDIGGKNLATLDFIFEFTALNEGRRKMLQIFALVVATALTISVFVGYLFQKSIARPVVEMADAARKIADGDKPHRIHYYSEDEIGDLVAGINKLSDDLKDTESRLRSAEQVAAWQLFARQTAHEIRNFLMPLVTTAAQLERWSQNGELDQARARDIAGTIRNEITRMKGLLASFSDFAKLPAPVIRNIPLPDLLAEVTRSFSEEAKSGRLHIESTGFRGKIRCDATQIHQVLVNLIKNSYEAKATLVNVGIRDENEQIWFEISDDGLGVDLTKKIDPFTPLYTTKENGSGLGLAICRRIIIDHGGDISFVPNPVKGTTFTFYLPLRES